jgi:hypothetical protein
MAWRDVCRRGRPAGGLVRQDDPGGGKLEDHDAGGASPGILKFVREVVRMTPTPDFPPKPVSFPSGCLVQEYPGYGAIDVHYEGRAVDVYLDAGNLIGKASGDWLLDWCVANCRQYQIQGVIFDKRQWFSEKTEVIAAGNRPIPYAGVNHGNHVHVELNGDGAALSTSGAPAAAAAIAGDLAGTWSVTAGTWKGLFVFDAFGNVYWADGVSSARHNGKWTATSGDVQWKFGDAGDFRTFTLKLPLNKASAQGIALPAGQGFFEMKKN